MSIFQTLCYKTRQQRQFYDTDIFSKFLIYFCSNIANALFGCVLVLSVYVFIVYKSQIVVRILLPLREQEMLEIFVYISVALKLIKVIHLIWNQTNIDIFFIDWERPKVFDNHINVKTHMDTPSISSGVCQLYYMYL